MRAVDADKLIDCICRIDGDKDTIDAVIFIIAYAPTVEPEENKDVTL